jgi:hypothetical protein
LLNKKRTQRDQKDTNFEVKIEVIEKSRKKTNKGLRI